MTMYGAPPDCKRILGREKEVCVNVQTGVLSHGAAEANEVAGAVVVYRFWWRQPMNLAPVLQHEPNCTAEFGDLLCRPAVQAGSWLPSPCCKAPSANSNSPDQDARVA